MSAKRKLNAKVMCERTKRAKKNPHKSRHLIKR